MAENELENIDKKIETENKVEERIRDLSSKVRTAAEERDKERELREQEAQIRAKAEKERDFYKGFSTLSSKYPQAAQFQDRIWEKHNAGYDLEDATVAVLAKEGKLTAPAPEKEIIAGGSAKVEPNTTKPPEEWTHEEKRKFLAENLVNS